MKSIKEYLLKESNNKYEMVENKFYNYCKSLKNKHIRRRKSGLVVVDGSPKHQDKDPYIKEPFTYWDFEEKFKTVKNYKKYQIILQLEEDGDNYDFNLVFNFDLMDFSDDGKNVNTNELYQFAVDCIDIVNSMYPGKY